MSATSDNIERNAIRLCAALFIAGKKDNAFERASSDAFVLPLNFLPGIAGMDARSFDAALACCADSYWLRVRLNYVQLTAAGVFVAKRALNLAQ
jgi:hypothetical protein